ncbi:MAG: DUF1735 domain-containing protein [Cyclobacteriaceae bacterium]|nr:DUF1735 domain-containing protein [Cyclobacteriaceae bacterium]
MKKFIVTSLVLITGLFLAACLDDSKYALDPEGYQNVIEFLDPSVPVSQVGAVYPVWLTAFTVAPQTTFTQTISFSGPQSNDKDIVLQLAVDPIALQEYNQQMTTGLNGAAPLGGATFELIPTNLYTISSLTATIPKGQKEATVSITVFPDQFDLSKSYALPLRIVSASSGTLSAHYSVAILATVVKNKYDGIYRVVQSAGLTAAQGMVDVTNAAFVGTYPKSIELRTVNGNTVNYYDHDFDLQGHVFSTGTGLSYYGGFAAQFIFNESDQVTDVVNAFGQGNNNRSAKLNTAQPSPPIMTFEADGTPKTLEIWYIMRQINTSTDRTFWKEVYTYTGPRD